MLPVCALKIKIIVSIFCKCEAVNYPESGKQSFWDAIHSEELLLQEMRENI